MKTKKLELNDGSIVELKRKSTLEFSALEIKIGEIVSDVIIGNSIDVDESLIGQGVDSLGLMEIAQKMEDEFNTEVTIEEISKTLSISLIAKLISQKTNLNN